MANNPAASCRAEAGNSSLARFDAGGLFQWWRGVVPFAGLADGRFVVARRESPPNELSSNLWAIDIDLETATTRGQPDVYIAPLEPNGTALGVVRRFTLDERHDYAAGWTHAGAAVLFHSNRGGMWDLFRQRIDAGAAEPLVVTSDQEEFPAV
jgi:hypothetical protein